MRNRTLVTLLVTCSVISVQARDNWPHWRGPSANGISAEKNQPTKWSATGTESVTAIDSTWERVVFTDSQPAASGRFGRLKVTMP